MLEELVNEIEPQAMHIFNATWQQQMFTEITEKLPKDWTVLVLHFAENYSCLSQDEIQSAHWATNQVTIHLIVAYYNCEHPDKSTHVVQEALVFISEDLKHDSHAAHHFEKEAIKYLKEKRGIPLAHVVEYSDGCAAHYKSRGPIADISFARVDYGVQLERAFFGSRHGKGPSDGVVGVVKSAVRRAVVSRRAVVNTAEDMFSFCDKNLTKVVKDKADVSSMSVEMK